jgi:hypothetical protein
VLLDMVLTNPACLWYLEGDNDVVSMSGSSTT